jgi:large subunit ribosomal protein L10
MQATAPRPGRAFAPARTAGAAPRRALVVSAAISRQKKEEVVTTLEGKLGKASIVFGMRYKGLDVATVQKFRKGLPEVSDMYVCKNSLMKVATRKVGGWAPLEERAGCEGENAWIFVPEDAIRDTIKHYFAFEKQLLEACGSLPTKKELLAKIAMLAKQPARKIAVGVKMVPTKLAIAAKKLSELHDDKSMTVAQALAAKA